MPIVRCDFHVQSDIVLDQRTSELPRTISGEYKIIYRNGPPDVSGYVNELLVTVIGPVSTFDDAHWELRSILASELDILGFITHARLKIFGPKLAMEWEAKQRIRKFRLFTQVDSRYPAAPALSQEYVDASQNFEKASRPLGKALKNFRYGLLEEMPEDQFMRFWLALEILATNFFNDGPKPAILCRHCREDAICKHCGKPPPVVPSSKQAIIELANRIIGAKSEEVHSKLFQVRHGIAHGQDPESILFNAKVEWPKLLFVLGKLVSDAILKVASLQNVPSPVPAFAGVFPKGHLIAQANGTYEYSGSADHPAEDKLPHPTVEMKIEVRKV